MPSLSTNGRFTFTNAGPLTTTFTPAASCTKDVYVGLTSPEVYLSLAASCPSDDELSGCTPTGTVTTSTTSVDLNESWERSYFSPGIYCPSGWTTVGAAARDTDKSLSTSGIMSTTSLPFEDYDIEASMLASILDPSETLALCCPSGMKGDWGIEGCWSAMPDYTASIACEREPSWIPYTKTFTAGTSVVTDYWEVPSGLETASIRTITLEENSKFSSMVAISAVPMVTLVHKESDLEAATTTATGSGAATSSNTAGKSKLASSAFDGVGMVVGVSVAAMALGAAIIFQ